jgi:ferrous iron transport protein A
MKLSEGEIGRTYRVKGISLAIHMERRLEALGLTCGAPICVMNKKRRGALIVKIRGTRFALGGSMADEIEVKAG